MGHPEFYRAWDLQGLLVILSERESPREREVLGSLEPPSSPGDPKSPPQGREVRDTDVVDVWKKTFPWGEEGCLLLIVPQTNRSRIPSKSNLGTRVYWAYLQSMGECGGPPNSLTPAWTTHSCVFGSPLSEPSSACIIWQF